MTVENTLAHGLKTSVFGSQWNVEHGENLALLDPDRIKSDTLANRPAFGAAHRFFFATDNQRIYYDNGAAWVDVTAAAAAHASSHAAAGADAITITEAQVTGLAADLAGKEPANANIQTHIASAANPHSTTAAQVGLGNAENKAFAAGVADATHAAASKTPPADADEFPLADSASSFTLKKLTWANLKAALKTYFDTLYPSGSGASSGTNTGDQTISDATISTTDITANNVSTTKHGFAPKAPNDATKYLDGSGAYSVPAGGGGSTDVAAVTHAATSKTPPVDADEFPLADSAAAFTLKKLTWANLKAAVKAYTDTLYPSGSGTSTGTNTGDQTNISGTAGNLSGTPALPNGTGAATQASGDNSTKLATTAYLDSQVMTRKVDGDIRKISQDVSILREFTCSAGSGALYTLLNANGNAAGQAMIGWSHNFTISSAGAFGTREGTQRCSFCTITEDGLLQYYAEPITNSPYTAGGTPTFALTSQVNMYTGDHQVLSMNGGQLAGNRNAMFNGACLVSLTGSTASAATDTYGQVEMACYAITARTAGTLDQLAGQTLSQSGYVSRAAGTTTSGGTGAVKWKYRIEAKDMLRFVNKTATFSIRVRHDAGSNVTYTITARNPTTTADTFSAVTDISNNGGAVVATGTDTTLTCTIACGASLKGIEIEVSAACGTVTTKNFDFAEWQFEIGSAATPFENRDYQSELARCQRYYCVLGGDVSVATLATAVNGTTTSGYLYAAYPVRMRVSPSFTQGSSIGNYALYPSGSVLTGSIVLHGATSNGVMGSLLDFTSTGLTVGGTSFLISNGTTAATLIFNARL